MGEHGYLIGSSFFFAGLLLGPPGSCTFSDRMKWSCGECRERGNRQPQAEGRRASGKANLHPTGCAALSSPTGLREFAVRQSVGFASTLGNPAKTGSKSVETTQGQFFQPAWQLREGLGFCSDLRGRMHPSLLMQTKIQPTCPMISTTTRLLPLPASWMSSSSSSLQGIVLLRAVQMRRR